MNESVVQRSQNSASSAANVKSARIKLIALFFICALPVIASYLTYYFYKPQGRTNYGTLVIPQLALGEVVTQGADGSKFSFTALRGKWAFVSLDSGACAQSCEDKLYLMRQVRLTTGRERERVERLWLLTDGTAPKSALLEAHEGLLRGPADAQLRQRLAAALPAIDGVAAGLTDHVLLIDPLGNLMMMFPAQADPSKVKKDVIKLLKASRIG
jgi:hypothetical protein